MHIIHISTVIATYAMSVCLSVCLSVYLSVISRYYVETTERMEIIFGT